MASNMEYAKRNTQNTDSRENKPKETSQSDPRHQTTSGIKVNKSHPESSTSRSYRPGNGSSDLTKSGQVFDPVSRSSHQLVQPGHQSEAVSKCDQIIKVKTSKKYSVKIKDDYFTCDIIGTCEAASGELLITDQRNRKVKLLDQTYKVVSHCDLPSTCEHVNMCSIDSSLVAVNTLSKKEVHFIRVTNGQLIKERTLKLQHKCIGIAHQHGNLYITDGTALYLYTVDGRLVREIYKDTPGYKTVNSCAVSSDGDRIYVVNLDRKQLVTLTRDGTVISTLTVPALNLLGVLPGLHVTDSGQVLVCLYTTDTIFQVDRDGRQILTEVVTENADVTCPRSVYYSKHTGSIIVGMKNNDDISVFKIQ